MCLTKSSLTNINTKERNKLNNQHYNKFSKCKVFLNVVACSEKASLVFFGYLDKGKNLIIPDFF